MAAFPVSADTAQRSLISTLWPELLGFRGDNARTRCQGRPHNHLPLGAGYSPELDKRCRLIPTNDSIARRAWLTLGRVAETYVKVKGKWKYLYRAVDSEVNTLDFMLRFQSREALLKQGAKRLTYD